MLKEIYLRGDQVNWNEYQKKTYRTKPNYLAVFLANKMEFNSIIDLGCGSGNDSVYMLKKGKQVISVDESLNEEYILDRITKEEFKNLTMIKKKFEDLDLPLVDCIFSAFALCSI